MVIPVALSVPGTELKRRLAGLDAAPEGGESRGEFKACIPESLRAAR
jgi:hypothetical protein